MNAHTAIAAENEFLIFWIEFSLNGRHIILPQELMQENAFNWQEANRNLPLGQEIVNSETSLAQVDSALILWNYNFYNADRFC